MARKVFKYTLTATIEEPQQVHMPVDATIVCVGSKNAGFIDIWALVDEDSTEHTMPRTFQVFGTGVPIPADAQYLDTSVQDSLHNGNRVWHLFERLAD